MKMFAFEPVEIAKSFQEIKFLLSDKELGAKVSLREEKNDKHRVNYSVLIDDIIESQEPLFKGLPLRKDVVNKKILRSFK
mmetsp:Transcript_23542/g.26125  ORF Transcript_23542/g.26125 Transcript_23542/m.26125 type:complete len:80 (+) Transcript_23542:1216-1455(+)